MSVAPGTRLGPYEITAKLGEGGMGEVWRATDARLGREVALKTLPGGFASDRERIERFRREARTLAALDHPGIVTVHSVEEIDGIHLLTMQLVDGQSLDRLIAASGMTLDMLLELGVEIAAAIAAAHEKGVVHRDLKPANVMIGRDGHVKVLDFGLASVAESLPGDATVSGPLTGRGEIVGTVPYMSPEQVAGRPLDARSDLFSLGVVLYEMATGRRPFAGDSAAELMSSILRDPPPDPGKLRADLPAGVASLLEACLRKAPEQRIQSAREVHEALALLRRSPGSGWSPAVATELSIVVLPFVNLSNDPENEYFSDGLTEEIITDLAKVKALRVISRSSAMRLKGASHDVRAIGRDLDVRYVLEGSVRKAGSNLRISAQLIDAASDAHLWSEKFSGSVDDVFEVQESVSREIVRALDVRLTSEESRRLGERPIADFRAFELYLQARQEVHRYAPDRALELLRSAVAIEGETPPLLALVAAAKVAQTRAGVGGGRSVLDEAEREARILLAKAPGTGYGHSLLGHIAYERGELVEAAHELKLALEYEPADSDARFTLCTAYIAAGQHAEAIETGRRMLAIDPLSPFSWVASGLPHWFVGEPERAIPGVERAIELDPHNPILRWCASYTYALADRREEAWRQADALARLAPGIPYARQIQALLAGLEGRREEALRQIVDLDLTPLDAHHRFHLAESFFVAGDPGRGFDLLEQAIEGGFYPFAFIAEHCPFLDSVRPHPRFAALRDRARVRCEAFRETSSEKIR